MPRAKKYSDLVGLSRSVDDRAAVAESDGQVHVDGQAVGEIAARAGVTVGVDRKHRSASELDEIGDDGRDVRRLPTPPVAP